MEFLCAGTARGECNLGCEDMARCVCTDAYIPRIRNRKQTITTKPPYLNQTAH